MDEFLVIVACLVTAFGAGVLVAGPEALGGLLIAAGIILFSAATLVHSVRRR